ncbi:hypothetical protein AAFC00_007209 [Neodothiora populina]|uniref:Translation initiation factor 3 C-terminal domain-containing protein n=1 Tax=Neodothiora populina TaxID=2781224 RepID=A0ABR3PHJ4_9PEZI
MNCNGSMTSARALYRVFIQPTLQQSSSATTIRSLHQSTNRILTRSLRPRPEAPYVPKTARVSHFSTSTSRPATRPPEKRTQLWDEEIRARLVRVVDPETQALLPAQGLRRVLQTFDRKTHRLVAMTGPPKSNNKGSNNKARGKASANNEEDDAAGDEVEAGQKTNSQQRRQQWLLDMEAEEAEEWIPTCRIISKKDQYLAEKARRKQQTLVKKASGEANTKIIELSWAIDSNDLSHRLKRVKEFLEDGKRVEVVIAKKKGGRKATPEECQGVVQKVKEAVEAIECAKTLKDMEGKMGLTATMFFEGVKK